MYDLNDSTSTGTTNQVWADISAEELVAMMEELKAKEPFSQRSFELFFKVMHSTKIINPIMIGSSGVVNCT